MKSAYLVVVEGKRDCAVIATTLNEALHLINRLLRDLGKNASFIGKYITVDEVVNENNDGNYVKKMNGFREIYYIV